MKRGALLLIAVLAAWSCKKAPPKGDLPPVGGPPATAAAKPTSPSTNPAGATAPTPTDTTPPPAANPHGMMPPRGEPKTPERLADGSYVVGPFALTTPAGWETKATSSQMRAAQFVLPAKTGERPELIVYYFGESGAGSVDSNLERWLDQFVQPDNKPSREVAKIEKTKFAGQDATYVSVAGRYVASAMPGATESVDKKDQALLAAIVESPKGPYYFKLVGAKTAIDDAAPGFRKMLQTMKVQK